MTERFAIATRDELWVDGRLVEQRLSCGEASMRDGEILATDARDPALVAHCDESMHAMRALVRPGLRMRLVATASTDEITRAMTISAGGHSVVATPETFETDVALLEHARGERLPMPELFDQAPPPVLWRNGSAAVLLHEACGHPLEHGRNALPLPPWLEVEIPLTLRRATFRDVPLLRMQHVIARQNEAPFLLPPTRVEVHLVDGGRYEPLTDVITLRIGAADLVERGSPRPLAPFTFEVPRRALVFAGASGDPVRYPGVVCSREGQELVVPSHAPLVLTELA